MRGNQFGELFNVTTFGESHGPAMGAVIDGCPAGVIWRQQLLEAFLERRRPGRQEITSARAEPDQAEILSGVFEGKTLGTPISAVIFNRDARSADYANRAAVEMRQGHATDLWQEKYGHSDPRGSGRASGRETVSRVLAGSVARMLVEQLYPEVRVVAMTSAVGEIALSPEETFSQCERLAQEPWSVDAFSTRCPVAEKNLAIENLLKAAKADGESFGGTVALSILGLPKYLGQPVFGKLKNSLASALMSVGATIAVDVGEGFAGAALRGKDFHREGQQYGGLRGGLSTGDPLALRVAFKPTSSRGAVAQLGRHDPCIVIRAIPVLEAMVWLVLADQILLARLDKI